MRHHRWSCKNKNRIIKKNFAVAFDQKEMLWVLLHICRQGVLSYENRGGCRWFAAFARVLGQTPPLLYVCSLRERLFTILTSLPLSHSLQLFWSCSLSLPLHGFVLGYYLVRRGDFQKRTQLWYRGSCCAFQRLSFSPVRQQPLSSLSLSLARLRSVFSPTTISLSLSLPLCVRTRKYILSKTTKVAAALRSSFLIHEPSSDTMLV